MARQDFSAKPGNFVYICFEASKFANISSYYAYFSFSQLVGSRHATHFVQMVFEKNNTTGMVFLLK